MSHTSIFLRCWIGALLVVATFPSATAKSLYPTGQGSDFTDNVAVQEGDIIMIVVDENASAESESNREREKESEVGGEANADADDATLIHRIAKNIPIFGATISGASSYESEREMDALNSLNTQISVRVQDVMQDGVLKLKGERRLKLDDEIKIITFEGLARKQDVQPDNTIPSDRIAEAQISYEGELGLARGEADGVIDTTWKYFKNVLFY